MSRLLLALILINSVQACISTGNITSELYDTSSLRNLEQHQCLSCIIAATIKKYFTSLLTDKYTNIYQYKNKNIKDIPPTVNVKIWMLDANMTGVEGKRHNVYLTSIPII